MEATRENAEVVHGSSMTRVLTLLFHDVYVRDPAESGFQGRAANRYKLTVHEFDIHLQTLACARPDPPVLLSRPVQAAAPVPFAITVDDGGASFFTAAAERLEALGWRAHCFVTTGQIGRPGFLDERQIRALHERGHVIGTHSISHPPRFGACPPEEIVREWRDSRRALEDILGSRVAVGSVPGGAFSARVASAATAAGLTLLFTSEPDTRARTVEGCTVMGRFTVRAGSGPGYSRSLALLEGSTMRREWAVWNLKKIAKALLGSVYGRLGAALD